MNRLPITKRELEILTLVSSGLNAALIAQKLFISRPTLCGDTINMNRKLMAKNKTQLINNGFANGLLSTAP